VVDLAEDLVEDLVWDLVEDLVGDLVEEFVGDLVGNLGLGAVAVALVLALRCGFVNVRSVVV